MSHYTRLQSAVNFIEENLDDPISLTDVSKAAFSSLSYFHRIFYFMTGFTVKEYIRKRRLSRSAYRLHCTSLSITDIALMAGYESLEAFTRAFKKYFHISPRAFRQTNQEQLLFDKLDILNQYANNSLASLDFDLHLEYVLYKQSHVTGFQISTTLEDGQQATDICHFANTIIYTKELEKYFDLSMTPIFGVYTNMTDENEFDYTIACLQSSTIHPSDHLKAHTIPTARYAKFTLNRLDRIKEAWHYIYGDWFPKHDQYRAVGFDFEIYGLESVDIYIPMENTPKS